MMTIGRAGNKRRRTKGSAGLIALLSSEFASVRLPREDSGGAMKLLKIAVLSATLLSGGCADQMAWQRADGHPIDGSFAWAAAECRGRAKEYEEAAAEAMQRCMRRRGYVWTAAPAGYY